TRRSRAPSTSTSARSSRACRARVRRCRRRWPRCIMNSEDNEEKKLPPEVRAAFTAEEPPAGFAERVVGAWQAERAAGAAAPVLPRRRGWSLAVGAATLAVAAALLLWMRPPPPVAVGERVGDHSVSERTTFNVGGRATAVAEGGSALGWKVAPG